eukprot:7309190-Prymnesium_polylepis.1
MAHLPIGTMKADALAHGIRLEPVAPDQRGRTYANSRSLGVANRCFAWGAQRLQRVKGPTRDPARPECSTLCHKRPWNPFALHAFVDEDRSETRVDVCFHAHRISGVNLVKRSVVPHDANFQARSLAELAKSELLVDYGEDFWRLQRDLGNSPETPIVTGVSVVDQVFRKLALSNDCHNESTAAPGDSVEEAIALSDEETEPPKAKARRTDGGNGAGVSS